MFQALPDRRAARRLLLPTQPPCLLQAPDADAPVSARVHNLSVRGIGVLSRHSYPPGSELVVILINNAHTSSLRVRSQVVRTFRLHDGEHYLGCQFADDVKFEQLIPYLL